VRIDGDYFRRAAADCARACGGDRLRAGIAAVRRRRIDRNAGAKDN